MTSSHEEWVGRLTPSDVHNVLFSRARLGRRGYHEAEVDVFLERVQQEISRLICEKADLRDDVARLESQLAQVGSQSSDAAPAGDSVTTEEAQLQAVRLLAAAQQTAEVYVADAEKHAQRLTMEARERSEAMLEEAKKAARRMVEGAGRLARTEAPRTIEAELPGSAGRTRQELEQQGDDLITFGQVVQVHLRSYLEALLRDIEEEWGADPGRLHASPVALSQGASGQGEPDAAAGDAADAWVEDPSSSEADPPEEDLDTVEASAQDLGRVEAPGQDLDTAEVPSQDFHRVEGPGQDLSRGEAPGEAPSTVETPDQDLGAVEAPAQDLGTAEAGEDTVTAGASDAAHDGGRQSRTRKRTTVKLHPR